MDLKTQVIEQYKKLKELNNGEKPLYRDFLKFSGLHGRKLAELYGSDGYSKLQIECGDEPNKLILERTPLNEILSSYGALVRKLGHTPTTSDWIFEKLKPTPNAITKVNGIKWSEMPFEFVKEFQDSGSWKDVLEILSKQLNTNPSKQTHSKAFIDVIEKIDNWTPNRKRVLEEGYKIELRNYLGQFFKIDEEVGESNADLVINGKIPIEVKRDPTQSEYDRLLGQMIRHNKLYGSALAVITNISSNDRFVKFKALFDEVHLKLDMKAELINK